MVKLALPLIALVAAASAAAVPATTTTATTTSGTTFSFSQWVEDIIANPDTALTPDEAVEAAQAADVVGSAGGLEKRAWCQEGGRANVCLAVSLRHFSDWIHANTVGLNRDGMLPVASTISPASAISGTTASLGLGNPRIQCVESARRPLWQARRTSQRKLS